MSETALFVDNEQGNATCDWCEASYYRRANNSKYCSDDCRREVANSQTLGKFVNIFPTKEYAQTEIVYQNYTPDYSVMLERHGVKPKQSIASTEGGTPSYKVPELGIKKFRETKTVMLFSLKQESKRKGWRQI